MAVNPRAERFFRAAWRVSMPLWLWAAHFFVSYAMVAATCLRDLNDDTTRLGLGVLTVGVAAWLAALLLARPTRRAHEISRSRGIERLRRAAAALALLAVAWSALPLLGLRVC